MKTVNFSHEEGMRCVNILLFTIHQDKSFTCTLFAPTTEFLLLDDPPSALAWFETNFPDALPLIGPEQLLESLKRNPRSPLIAIKVKFFQVPSNPKGFHTKNIISYRFKTRNNAKKKKTRLHLIITKTVP